jgi:hypothetical protein
MRGFLIITWERHELVNVDYCYEYYFAFVNSKLVLDGKKFCLGFIALDSKTSVCRYEYFLAAPYEQFGRGCKSFVLEDSSRSEKINTLQKEFTRFHHDFIQQFFAF